MHLSSDQIWALNQWGFAMRRAIAFSLASIMPICAMAQEAPAGWSTIVGKTCEIRTTTSGGEAKFIQGDSGPSVELKRLGATKTVKVTFNPPNEIAFESFTTADGLTFSYDDKAKTWSGIFAGLPAYLECPP